MVFSPESVLRLALTDLKPMTKQPSAAVSRTLADAEREHTLDVLKQTDGLIGGAGLAAHDAGLQNAETGHRSAPAAPAALRAADWGWS